MSADETVHIIAGPTAGGKSALALERARRTDGVIINADSLQVYDALPLLTAQPGSEDFQAAPHKLYGAFNANDRCTAPRWRDLALDEIGAAFAQGKAPVLVGGTGFYIKALTQGLSPIPDVPPAIRQEAVALQEKLGNPAFHAALAERDPVMAARLHPNDTQRLIRAWEVFAATGQSLAAWQDVPPVASHAYKFTLELVIPEREELRRRCDTRFDAMMEKGVLDEVAAFDELIRKGNIPDDAGPTQALGFRPLQAYLRGQTGRDEAVDRAKAETRQYAKRQVTWFRHQLAGLDSASGAR